WCEDWPLPTDDPHCRKAAPRKFARASVFGDGLECTEPPTIPPPPVPTGIFAKAHQIVDPMIFPKHTSMRITPQNQLWWRTLKPEYFVNQDGFGSWFATIGAGPGIESASCGGSDTSCFGEQMLTSAVNRCNDVNKTPTHLERLRYPEG